jgi:hypothetical protein
MIVPLESAIFLDCDPSESACLAVSSAPVSSAGMPSVSRPNWNCGTGWT